MGSAMRNDIYIPLNFEEMTPMVDFKTTGELRIEGKSYPENPVNFYEPLIDWLKEFKIQCPHKITMNIRLEYFNTSTSKLVLYMFKILEDIYLSQKSDVIIYWLYNKQDEDMYESGLDYQSIIDLPFEFVGYN
jgi:hypothetical protein